MKRITALPLILSALILAATSTNATAEGSGFLMLEEPSGPRNAAMGSAGTALGSGGFHYYNPAQPFFSDAAFAAAEFGQMPGGVNRGGFETVIFYGDWFSAAGFQSSSVDFETRDEHGFGAAASSVTTMGALGAGYIRGSLALAVSAHITDDRIWVEEGDYRAYSFSAGLGYRMLDGKLNLGAAALHGVAWSRGYGSSDSSNTWHSGKTPVFARAGAAWSDTVKFIPYTITADAAYNADDGTISVPVGIEVSILPSVNLRLGKRIGWDNEVMSFGIGFNLDRLSFDAAFIPTVFVDDYEMKWSMGFTYRMGRPRKKGIEMEPIGVRPESPDAAEAPGEPDSSEEAGISVPVEEEPAPEPEPQVEHAEPPQEEPDTQEADRADSSTEPEEPDQSDLPKDQDAPPEEE